MSQVNQHSVAMDIDDPESVLAALDGDGGEAVVVASDPVATAASAAGVTTVESLAEALPVYSQADRAVALALWRSRQGAVARGDQRCMICGLRWQRSDRAHAGGTIYMFPCPSGSEWTRWKLSLKLPSRQTARRGERICSLHFRPGETRVLLVNGGRLAHTLPVAAPKRAHFDERTRAPARACSFPLCRGLRQQLLDVLMDIQQRGSSMLRRTVRPYWSRRRFAVPEPGPTNQAWVELFSEALNGRPNLPDQVELASLCALHFTPNWFRWENRGRPRLLDDPIGDPKLDKYAEPTIFSSSALIRALRMALEEDIVKQAELKQQQKQQAAAAKPKPPPPPPRPTNKIRCGYPYCEGGTILFPLPADRDQRKLWLRSLSAVLIAFGEPPGFDIKTCTHLCSFHFNEEEIEHEGDGTITLAADAVPSRFNRPSVELEEPAPVESEPVKVVSWPDQLASLIADTTSSQQQQQQQLAFVSSDEEVVEVEEDSGFLPRLELQIAVDRGNAGENGEATVGSGEGVEVMDGVAEDSQERRNYQQQRQAYEYDEDYLCSDEEDDENWRPTSSSSGRGRGKSRGRPRGRARGRARTSGTAMRDLSSPPPAPRPSSSQRAPVEDTPPPAIDSAAIDVSGAAAEVVRQSAALADAALAGYWPAVRAVDSLRAAVYNQQVGGAGDAGTVTSADQLIKLCLIRRLRRAAASAAVAAVSSQTTQQQVLLQNSEDMNSAATVEISAE